MPEKLCQHCGGEIAIRNPRGDCDHLYWPHMLTDEAKAANGFRRVWIEQWQLPAPADEAPTANSK